MGTISIDIQEISNITRAISDYEYLPNIFQHLGNKEQNERLQAFWNKNVVKRETSTHLTHGEYVQWKEIDLHVVPQTWGNTSGGWQGIGGSAMTKAYTVIIENGFGFACVYYNGELAYICEMDEKYQEMISKGYDRLPGCNPYQETLTILYKKNR